MNMYNVPMFLLKQVHAALNNVMAFKIHNLWKLSDILIYIII